MLRDEFVTTQKTRRTVLRRSLCHTTDKILLLAAAAFLCCWGISSFLRSCCLWCKLDCETEFFFQTKQKKVASIRNKIITKEIGSKVILTQDLLPTFFYYVAFAKKCSRLYLVHISLFSFLPKRKFTILKIKPCVLLTFVSWRFPFQMLVFSSDNNNGFW